MEEPEITPNRLGGGRPATVGGDAPAHRSTMGGPLAGQAGSPHAYPSLQETSLATVENDYAITLEKEDGSRTTIETIIGDFSPAREHSALSDWDAVVPYDEDLEEFLYDSRAWITWDGRTVFTGYCKVAGSQEQDAETTLSGPGPGADLQSGVHSMTFENVQVWRAFRRLFEEVAEDWTFHVDRPPEPTVISSFEVSGNALECIEELAEKYHWSFLVHQSRWHHIEAFKPAHRIGTATWQHIDSEREKDTTDYYNATGVIGDVDEDGEQVIGYYEDTTEIAEHAARRGISYTRARKIQAIEEDTDDWDEADAVAEARTEEAIAEAEVGGSIETYPTLIDPGKAYPIRQWDDDARVGAYSLLFDGDSSRVSLPPRVLQGLESGGGLALWARAEWTELEDAPLLGSSDSGPQIIADDGEVTFELADTSVTLTDRPLFDSEWLLLHPSWISDGSETLLRGGHGGELVDAEVISGEPDLDVENLWLGHDGSEFYAGHEDYIQIFRDEPSEEHFDAISEGDDVPASLVRARYFCNEGPNYPGTTLFDSRSGHHGELEDVEYAGRPKLLQTTQYTHGAGTADCTLHFEKDRSTAAEVERIKRDIRGR